MTESYPQAERQGRAPAQTQPGLWIGVGLVMIGAMLMLDHVGIHLFRGLNWWALFLLIPAGVILRNVNDAYQAGEHTLNRTMRTQLVVGIMLMALATFYLFGIGTAMLWPLLLIGVGALVIAGRI